MSAEVVARWDGFLGKLRARAGDVLSEARAGSTALLDQTDDDLQPLSNAWDAIRARMLDLGQKIDEVWTSEVDPKLEAAGVREAALDHEREKGAALRGALDVEYERHRVAAFGDAARRLLARAAEPVPDVACPRCGFRFRPEVGRYAVDVPCGHCRAVITCQPSRWIWVAESAAHCLAEESAFPAWLAAHAAEEASRKTRGRQLALMKAEEAARIAHARAYFGAVAARLPERAATLEHDVRSRMAHWYAAADREEVWLAAGRPAALSARDGSR
jgi:hypothetical protein